MRLICTKTMTYNTRRLMAGDEFTAAKPSDYRVLIAIGKAEVAPEKRVEPKNDDEHKPKSKKRKSRK